MQGLDLEIDRSGTHLRHAWEKRGLSDDDPGGLGLSPAPRFPYTGPTFADRENLPEMAADTSGADFPSLDSGFASTRVDYLRDIECRCGT